MQLLEENEHETEPLKSLNADLEAYVTFVNRSPRCADIFWVNYGGELVQYATLPPHTEFECNTFETHPWVFRDAEYHADVLLGNKSPVFRPKAWQGEEARKIVFIDLPVFTLRQRCLQVVRRKYNLETADQLDIPFTLKIDLIVKNILNFNVYENYYKPQQQLEDLQNEQDGEGDDNDSADDNN